MLCEVPLTKEQQAFATDHHGLVYKFLNENNHIIKFIFRQMVFIQELVDQSVMISGKCLLFFG